MNDNLKKENDLDNIKKMNPEDAVKAIETYLIENPQDDEAYTIRGLKYWSMGRRREAINDYLTAIKINPESRARMALQYANSVLDYYNKDLLNP